MSKNELLVSKIFKGDISIPYKERIQIVQDHMISIADDKNVFGNGKDVIHPPMLKYKHSFADGVYIREMTAEQGIVLIGAIHKYREAFFLLTGKLVLMTKDGVEEYIAPCYVIAPSGSKKMGYFPEQSVVVTVHANPSDTTDIDKLEKDISVCTWKEYDEFLKQKKHEKNK
tara:strand:- start:4441 stop:4953 length:513 start_codon:yes stop_codon:yes gene_type:complete